MVSFPKNVFFGTTVLVSLFEFPLVFMLFLTYKKDNSFKPLFFFEQNSSIFFKKTQKKNKHELPKKSAGRPIRNNKLSQKCIFCEGGEREFFEDPFF
jgi:hypothetical protein